MVLRKRRMFIATKLDTIYSIWCVLWSEPSFISLNFETRFRNESILEHVTCSFSGHITGVWRAVLAACFFPLILHRGSFHSMLHGVAALSLKLAPSPKTTASTTFRRCPDGEEARVRACMGAEEGGSASRRKSPSCHAAEIRSSSWAGQTKAAKCLSPCMHVNLSGTLNVICNKQNPRVSYCIR